MLVQLGSHLLALAVRRCQRLLCRLEVSSDGVVVAVSKACHVQNLSSTSFVVSVFVANLPRVRYDCDAGGLAGIGAMSTEAIGY